MRAYTGIAMRLKIVTSFSPSKVLRLARVVREAGVPLLGFFDKHASVAVDGGPLGGDREAPQREHAGTRGSGAAASGLRVTNDGPDIGSMVPAQGVTTLQGETLRFAGQASGSIVVFMSTSCPHCDGVAGHIVPFGVGRNERVVLVFSEPGSAALRLFLDHHGLGQVAAAVAPELRSAMGVTGVPYGFAIDSEGVVRGKGIVNAVEHLDQLAAALYMSVETVRQAFAYVEMAKTARR